MRHHEIFFPGSWEDARRALNAAAAAWGAAWSESETGGELALPVVQALRRGVLRGRVDIAAEPPHGVRIRFEETEVSVELNRGAVAVLGIGALAGILLVLWPFLPQLLVAAPLAAVLAFLAWFMVVARLRVSGPEEFLSEVLASARESG